jgi:hypothetical protein
MAWPQRDRVSHRNRTSGDLFDRALASDVFQGLKRGAK